MSVKTNNNPQGTPPFHSTLQRPQQTDTGVLIIDVQARLLSVVLEPQKNGAMKAIGAPVDSGRNGIPPRPGYGAVSKRPRFNRPVNLRANPRPDRKLTFACTDTDAFLTALNGHNRRRWILAGLETHICVFQTVRGLLALGHEVHVPADAVMSRIRKTNRSGFDLISRLGAVVTTTETLLRPPATGWIL